jgi:hypothetical protein
VSLRFLPNKKHIYQKTKIRNNNKRPR